jgi:electron transfer flavoprotein alpha subunit
MPESILVFAEHQGGKIVRPTWEAIAAAQQIGKERGAPVSAVILGEQLESLVAELAAAELSEVVAVCGATLKDYTPAGYALSLRRVVDERQPDWMIFSHTYQVRDFAPKLAALLGRSLASDCLGYRREDGKMVFVRQVFQGKFNADVELVDPPPRLVTFQSGSFREDAVSRGANAAPVTFLDAARDAAEVPTVPGERFREARQAVDLTQAEFIVAVGRGIKAPENLDLAKRLAEALGAELGASRPICDSGWLPMDRQIGSSGQTVAPKLYVALGISGAIQHQVGMKGARTVVAVNKDKEAPIFEVASYGIAGDLFEIVPPLIEELKKVKAG